MTDWDRVQSLFDDLAATPPQERAAALAEACGDDGELRAEVESLLEHDSRADGGFLQPPELPPEIDESNSRKEAELLIGSRIGRYHVKRLIATGGMGSVYEAVQEQPERIVALKILHRNVASRSALRRFQLESHILGHLRHRNIAHVHEAGMHEIADVSVPYFAMEYVPDARSIIEFSNEKSLKTRDRLQLFAKVCDAVHHGHQKGIIHRDLKPANILVDASGEPKVIDFGVARATDADIALTTVQTDAGQLIGTLQYMSPEQCDADPDEIDTRSDVYSLGVVLYELLTGSLPYDVADTTIVQAARVIREQAPKALSSLNRKLRGDVDTIVLKALDKDRAKRYQSAAELAADIRRHLNREPIEARPPTAWTRTVRWVIRHPIWATAAVCGLIVVITFATTSLGYWVLYKRPYGMQLVKRPELRGFSRGCEARLLSAAGVIVRSWTSDNPGGVSIAELLERPARLGGGRVGVLGFRQHTGQAFAGSLYAIDVDGDLDTPLWQRRVETDEIPKRFREKRGFVGGEFSIEYAAALDVFPEDLFPEHPGDEIVVTFGHQQYSPRVLRIYNLAGERLYQFWHDGAINSWHWMEDARRLVVGANSQEPFFTADGQAKDGVSRTKAHVVFAVCPRPNYILDETLPLKPGDDPNDPLVPVWFRSLYPEDAAQSVFQIRVVAPRPSRDAGRLVRVEVYFDESYKRSLSWELDEHGAAVSAHRNPSEDYKFDLALPSNDPRKANLPDPNQFHLAPFQPPTATSGAN